MSSGASRGAFSNKMLATSLVTAVAVAPVVAILVVPWLLRIAGRLLGWYLTKKTDGRREQLLEIMRRDQTAYEDERRQREHKRPSGLGLRPTTDDEDDWEQISAEGLASAENGKVADKEWDGIVGFFHPFCNAGGGGERVLWAAIRATQNRWPKATCVVYTGDHDASKDTILQRVRTRFNIHLHPPTVTFVYLTTRRWVLASTWPRFTLIGQSIGSIIVAWDAFSLVVPDIFIDTMGYAFAVAACKLLFPLVPTGAYVHYPTISTDMLESLDPRSAVGSQGVNAGQGAGTRGAVKKAYWRLFARLYGSVGASVDVVMTNSSWTQDHIAKLWGPARESRTRTAGKGPEPIAVVYPPVAVRELEREIEVSAESEKRRGNIILYIAQFRPEKNHAMVINAFAELVRREAEEKKKKRQQQQQQPEGGPTDSGSGARLVLVGSVRDDGDSKRVYELRLLVNELHVRDRVEFHLDATWPEILEWLRRASVGVNGMWNEHFGIGVVEYQAAGLISVVHDSGGPKMDIVTAVEGEPTGYLATTEEEFADGFAKALSLRDPLSMRKRARQSAKRFAEEVFAKKWISQMEILVGMAR